MATTVADNGYDLAVVRRLEAAGFRAWPAASIQYDGAWQIRLTAGHPSRRLNSVNALDPSDGKDIARRVARLSRRFDAYGRRPVFRQTPLTPPGLEAYLVGENWRRMDETIVMLGAIEALALQDVHDQLPIRDIGRYVDAAITVHGRDPALKPGLTEVLSSIRPESGLFVLEDKVEGPVATVLCVRDNDLAGIFELATRADHQRRGLARGLVSTALRWARMRGAERAWLQVETENVAAVTLYERMGFEPVYRYAYRERRED